MQRLHVSRTNKVILGLCGGIGETFHIDPNVVRFLMGFLCIVTGIIPLVIVYFLAGFILPRQKD